MKAVKAFRKMGKMQRKWGKAQFFQDPPELSALPSSEHRQEGQPPSEEEGREEVGKESGDVDVQHEPDKKLLNDERAAAGGKGQGKHQEGSLKEEKGREWECEEKMEEEEEEEERESSKAEMRGGGDCEDKEEKGVAPALMDSHNKFAPCSPPAPRYTSNSAAVSMKAVKAFRKMGKMQRKWKKAQFFRDPPELSALPSSEHRQEGQPPSEEEGREEVGNESGDVDVQHEPDKELLNDERAAARGKGQEKHQEGSLKEEKGREWERQDIMEEEEEEERENSKAEMRGGGDCGDKEEKGVAPALVGEIRQGQKEHQEDDEEELPEGGQAEEMEDEEILNPVMPSGRESDSEPLETEQAEALKGDVIVSPTIPNDGELPEGGQAEEMEDEEILDPVMPSDRESDSEPLETEQAEALKGDVIELPEGGQAEEMEDEEILDPVMPSDRESDSEPLETEQAEALKGDVIVSPTIPNDGKQAHVERLANRVKVPAGAPRIQDWFVQREAVIASICGRLEVSDDDGRRALGGARVVGLAGPSGAGKSTIASMIVARKDVRAHFSQKGVVWLAVGPGAKDRLPKLMHHLSVMVHELVVSSSSPHGRQCRPPRTPDIGVEPEDGAAYIREVMALGEDERSNSGGSGSEGLLVVADDVAEAEVLEELRKTGAWILYTTRSEEDLVAASGGDPPLRVDEVTEREAEAILRRAAELDDDVELPHAAREMIRRGGPVAMDLAYVGRWLRRQNDLAAWAEALDDVLEAQNFMEGAALLPWRLAVLRAGLARLTLADERNKKLYLSLVVLLGNLAFSVDDMTALLHDDVSAEEEHATEDRKSAKEVVATLEHWSVLTQLEGGRYRVNQSHAEVAWQGISDHPAILRQALARWWKRVSTPEAVFAWGTEELVDIWKTILNLITDGGLEVRSPSYAAIVDAVYHSHAWASHLLRRVAYFQWLTNDRDAACESWSKLIAIEESANDRHLFESPDGDYPHVNVTMYTLGVHALESGRTEEAAGWFRRTLSIEEKALGPDDTAIADTLRQIASCAFREGRVEEAEVLHLRALAIRENKQGSEHLDVANTLHSLGLCVLRPEESKLAERYLRRALRIFSDKLGATDSRVSTAMYDLGRCFLLQEQTREAEEYLHRALSIQERNEGSKGLAVANTLQALGGCMSDAGKLTAAAAFYRRALAIRERSLGVDDPATARSVHALAQVLLEARNTEEAGGLYRRALVHVENHLGSNHPVVADTCHGLGACALAEGRFNEAETSFRRALAIRENTLGANHPNVAHTLYDFGRCAAKAGRFDDAEGFYRRALVLVETNLGDRHEEVATILYSLGVCVAEQGGRTEEVKGLFERALEIREEQKVGMRPTERSDMVVADIFDGLGVCAFESGQLEVAAKYHRRALAIFEEMLGTDHPKVAFTLQALGRCLLKAGRAEEAEVSFRRVLGATTNSTERRHVSDSDNLSQPLVADTLEFISRCALHEGRTEEALGLLCQVLEMREESLGADHPKVATTLYTLGRCFYNDGRLAEADYFLSCALSIQERKLHDGHPDLSATLKGRDQIRQKREFFR